MSQKWKIKVNLGESPFSYFLTFKIMKKFLSILVTGALCVPSLGFALSVTESRATTPMLHQDISVKNILVKKTGEYNSDGEQKIKLSTYVLNKNPKEDTVLWWGYKVDGNKFFNDRFDLKSTYFSVLLTKGEEYGDFYLAPGKHTIEAYANPEIIDYNMDNNVLTKRVEIEVKKNPKNLSITRNVDRPTSRTKTRRNIFSRTLKSNLSTTRNVDRPTYRTKTTRNTKNTALRNKKYTRPEEAAPISTVERDKSATTSKLHQDISVKNILVQKIGEYNSDGEQKIKLSTYVLNKNPKEDTVLWWGYKVDGKSLFNDRFDLKSTHFSVLLTKGEEYGDFYLAPGKHMLEAYANPEIIDYNMDNNVLTKRVEIQVAKNPRDLSTSRNVDRPTSRTKTRRNIFSRTLKSNLSTTKNVDRPTFQARTLKSISDRIFKLRSKPQKKNTNITNDVRKVKDRNTSAIKKNQRYWFLNNRTTQRKSSK